VCVYIYIYIYIYIYVCMHAYSAEFVSIMHYTTAVIFSVEFFLTHIEPYMSFWKGQQP
jgi:hypothetical protein